MTVGRLIQEQIQKSEITQRELARQIGMDHASVQRYIKGQRIPPDTARKIAYSLFDSERGRTKFLRQWKEDDSRAHIKASERRKLKGMKRTALKKFYTDFEIDLSYIQDEALPKYRPAIPIIQVLRIDKDLLPYQTPNPIITFNAKKGFSSALGESRHHYDDGHLSLAERVLRFENYCDNEGVEPIALVELARDFIQTHSVLQGASYYNRGWCLIHHGVANSWGKELDRFTRTLMNEDSSRKDIQFASSWIKNIADELKGMKEYSRLVEEMQKDLLRQVDEVAHMLNSSNFVK